MMKCTICLCLLFILGCSDETAEQIQRPHANNVPKAATVAAPVVVEANILENHGGDKYYYYNIKVLKVIKNSIKVNLDSSIRVARFNIETQPELNKKYILDLDYYNEANPEYGLKIVGFKEK